MKSFRDTAGREWTIEINYTSLARVKDATGVDLTDICDPESDGHRKLAEDVRVMFRSLCALLQPQLESRDVSPEALGEAIDEEAAEGAWLAITEGVVDFFRGPKRALFRRALAKSTEVVNRRRTEGEAKLEALFASGEMDRMIEHAIEQQLSTSGKPDSASPGSSTSIPVPAP